MSDSSSDNDPFENQALLDENKRPFDLLTFDDPREARYLGRHLPSLDQIVDRIQRAIQNPDPQAQQRPLRSIIEQLCAGYRIPALDQVFVWDRELQAIVPYNPRNQVARFPPRRSVSRRRSTELASPKTFTRPF